MRDNISIKSDLEPLPRRGKSDEWIPSHFESIEEAEAYGTVKQAPRGRTFNLQAAHLALTYPQCPLKPETVMTALLMLPVCKGREVVVVSEKHKSGDLHIHAYVGSGTKGKLRVTKASYFDIVHGQGEATRVYHPNILVCHKVQPWLGYMFKDNPPYASTLSDNLLVLRLSGKKAKTSQIVFNQLRTQPTLDDVEILNRANKLVNGELVKNWPQWRGALSAFRSDTRIGV